MRRLREMLAVAILGLTVVGVAGLKGIEAATIPSEQFDDQIVAGAKGDCSKKITSRRCCCCDETSTHLTYQRVHGGVGP